MTAARDSATQGQSEDVDSPVVQADYGSGDHGGDAPGSTKWATVAASQWTHDGLHEKHPHSLKPGRKTECGDDEDDLDVTWLDKLITAVERKLKAFFRMEI